MRLGRSLLALAAAAVTGVALLAFTPPAAATGTRIPIGVTNTGTCVDDGTGWIATFTIINDWLRPVTVDTVKLGARTGDPLFIKDLHPGTAVPAGQSKTGTVYMPVSAVDLTVAIKLTWQAAGETKGRWFDGVVTGRPECKAVPAVTFTDDCQFTTITMTNDATATITAHFVVNYGPGSYDYLVPSGGERVEKIPPVYEGIEVHEISTSLTEYHEWQAPPGCTDVTPTAPAPVPTDTTLTGEEGVLALTGTPVGAVAGAGLLLLVAGGGGVLVARRRRVRFDQP